LGAYFRTGYSLSEREREIVRATAPGGRGERIQDRGPGEQPAAQSEAHQADDIRDALVAERLNRVRTRSFAARPPDLRCFALTTTASRFVARSPCSAPPHIRFLSIGPRLRSALPPHTRSPSCSCASLHSPWSAYGRTCTSKIAPMLGAQRKRPASAGPFASSCGGAGCYRRPPNWAGKARCPGFARTLLHKPASTNYPGCRVLVGLACVIPRILVSYLAARASNFSLMASSGNPRARRLHRLA
jgi:hypothetical protein